MNGMEKKTENKNSKKLSILNRKNNIRSAVTRRLTLIPLIIRNFHKIIMSYGKCDDI